MKQHAIALASCLFFACVAEDPAACPKRTVVLDGGADALADGLPDVGEYGSCPELCGPREPVCRRVSELTLTCQPGCG